MTDATGALALPAPPGAVPPGPWRDDSLGVAISGVVRDDGWIAGQRAPGFFDLQLDPGSPDVIAVQLAAVEAAAAGRDAWHEQPTAAEAIRAIEANVELLPRTDATVGRVAGHEALTIEIDALPATTDGGGFVPVIRVAAGAISLGPGRRLRLSFVEAGNGLLAVLVGGSIARWDATLAAAEPVVATLGIAAAG